MRATMGMAVALSVGAVGGYLVPRPGPPLEVAPFEAPQAPPVASGITGIGGIFFKSGNPDALRAWYRTHLGIKSAGWGGYAFQWHPKDQPAETGYTVWSAFPDSSDYFEPSDAHFMVSYRVVGLDDLVAELRRSGVTVIGEIEGHPNGRFAWIVDPDGRKVELWEPVPSQDDPYLQLP